MKAIARRPRVFQLDGLVSGPLPPGIENWPPVMQDNIYAMMEAKLEATGIKAFEIVQADCYQDEPGPLWSVRIVLMEKLGPEDVVIVHG